MKRLITTSFLVSVFIVQPALSQGTKADYERAAALRRQTQGKVLRANIEPQWLNGGERFWYRRDDTGGAAQLVLIDANTGTRSPLFDADRLASALKDATGAPVDGAKLPIERLSMSGTKGAERAQFTLRGRDDQLWIWDAAAGALTPGTAEQLTAFQSEQAPRRGGRGGTGGAAAQQDTEIVFRNQTNDKILLYWIDTGGERRPYGEIAAGAERTQHTYVGHRWAVTDSEGRDLRTARGERRPSTVVIDASSSATATSQPQERAAGAPQQEAPQRPPQPRNTQSPDRKWRAVVRDRNLYLQDADGNNEIALSTDGAAAEGFDGRVFWSPDSSKLIAMRGTPGDERKVYYIESSPRDQLQPELHSYDYLKPGDNVPQYWPRLFDITNQKEIGTDRALCSNPYSLEGVRWKSDSSAFTFMYNQRGHQALRLIEVDATTGAARAIIDETSKTFIDYSGKQYLQRVAGTDELIWMSERDGWNHLYLYDGNTGAVKNQITKGKWVVRDVDRVDDAARQIWFRAGGIRPEQDPYYIHYCRVNFDGSGLTILTEGDGTHTVDFSPDRRWFIDTWSRVDQPPVTELRRSDDGSLVAELERADWSALLATGWKPPERFVAKGRDGATDIYGIIIRPTNFDSSKKYPVIESIYAGPQDSFVPKNFRAYHNSQEIGELGFIMVHIDGMGTSNRSKAFHDVCWKNLADAGLPDRVAWMKAAAAEHPEMDLSRVGIYGGSAGGQNALGALLLHGEFYKAGVADCGCHDNRMDKMWWNEQWMGWPVGPEYAANSNVTLAPRLTGKLMLVVGEMDQNVDPASTMQVAGALIRADKDFDLLVIPGAGHGAGESPYGRRRRQDFFVRNLLGVEPRIERVAQGPG